jgi:hypothetical protein
MVQEGLRTRGWTEKELSEHPKRDKAKVKLARQLRGQTTMTLRWIANGCGWDIGAAPPTPSARNNDENMSLSSLNPFMGRYVWQDFPRQIPLL